MSYELHTSELPKRGMGGGWRGMGRREERDGEEGGEGWGGGRRGMGRKEERDGRRAERDGEEGVEGWGGVMMTHQCT